MKYKIVSVFSLNWMAIRYRLYVKLKWWHPWEYVCCSEDYETCKKELSKIPKEVNTTEKTIISETV